MKKLVSIFLSLCFCLCLFTPVCFADDSAYDHTHNWVKEKIHSYSLEYNGVAFGIDVFKCSECALYLHTLKFLGYEVPVIRASPDTSLGSEAAAMCAQAMVAVFGKEWYATKFEAGGGSASPGGVGRNPAGYAGEGVPSVNSTGVLCMVVEPLGMCSNWNNNGFYTNDNENLIVGASSGGSSYPSDNEVVVYKFVAPASGTYYIGNLNGSSYNYGSISIFCSDH